MSLHVLVHQRNGPLQWCCIQIISPALLNVAQHFAEYESALFLSFEVANGHAFVKWISPMTFFPKMYLFSAAWSLLSNMAAGVWTLGDCPSTYKHFIMRTHSFRFSLVHFFLLFRKSFSMLLLKLAVWVGDMESSKCNPDIFISYFHYWLRLYLCPKNLIALENTCILLI